MIKNLFIKALCGSILCFFTFFPCSAQQEFDYLDVNNVKAYINPLHLFFNNGAAAFEVPKNSGKTTIFTSNLWLGGKTESGNVCVAAQTYCQQGKRDFWLGPIRTSDASFDPTEEYIQKYNHTWKVSREEINYHRAHYADPGYEMPWGIANWPAYSGAELGEIISLAPYKDVNGDGIYNPLQGDYPIIRGDQAVFFIMNDKGGPHTESGGMPIGVEILGMAYAFNSPDTMLQNTIFLSYELRNKGYNTLYDFYFGFWTNFAIGYAWDDYMGCDTSLNLAYGYNGMEIDGNGQPEAYGLNPPAQGVMFLNQKMSTFMYHGNDASVTGFPQSAMDYYNYLRAIWRDGRLLTYGGSGYDFNATCITNYMWSGKYSGEWWNGSCIPSQYHETGWSEEFPNGAGSPQSNIPDNRRGIMSAGPFTFSNSESIKIDIALPFARTEKGKGKNSLEALALLKQMALEVQEYYDENIVGIKENKYSFEKLMIYPNPSNGQFTVASEKVIECIELYNVLGKKVFVDTPKAQTTQITTHLPQGFYIYRAVLQCGSVSSGKIIVQ